MNYSYRLSDVNGASRVFQIKPLDPQLPRPFRELGTRRLVQKIPIIRSPGSSQARESWLEPRNPVYVLGKVVEELDIPHPRYCVQWLLMYTSP